MNPDALREMPTEYELYESLERAGDPGGSLPQPGHARNHRALSA